MSKKSIGESDTPQKSLDHYKMIKLKKTVEELDRKGLYQLTNMSIEYLKLQLISRKITRKEKIDIAKTVVAKAFPKDFTMGGKDMKSFTEMVKELHMGNRQSIVIHNEIKVESDREDTTNRISPDIEAIEATTSEISEEEES